MAKEINQIKNKTLFLVGMISFVLISMIAILAIKYFVQDCTPGLKRLSTSTQFVGPTCFIDNLNQYGVWLPRGWYGSPSKVDKWWLESNLFNYDPQKIKYSHGAPLNLPADHLRVRISVGKLADGPSAKQWISDWISKYTPQVQTSSFRLGPYEAVILKVSKIHVDLLQILISTKDGRVFRISFSPTDSEAIPQALRILSRLSIRQPE